MQTVTRKIGRNRDKRRLWIEGAILSGAGFTKGKHYTIEQGTGLTLRLDDNGARKVAGTPDRPIIDINSDKTLGLFGDTVTIKASQGFIEII